MKEYKLVLISLILLSCCVNSCLSTQMRGNQNELPVEDEKKLQLSQTIRELNKRVRGELYEKDTHFFGSFPPKFDHMKGLYGSYIHGNYIDSNNTYMTHLIRTNFKCDDNNMFVSNFILMALIDSYELGAIDISLKEFEWTIDAILQFRDKSTQQGLPVYSFWPQKKINGTWVAEPSNIDHILSLASILPQWAQNLLDKMGLSFLRDAKDIRKMLLLPPDIDDSSVNIALGQRLKQFKSLKNIEKKWSRMNKNISAYYDLQKQNAYRPFANLNSSSARQFNDTDVIDPRSYFAFYKFFDEEYENAKKEERQPNLTLFSTWILNREMRRSNLSQTNDIDVSVNANAIFALNSLLVNENDSHSFFDGELQGMYLNATNLIAYTINSGRIQERPDIVMLYYPSVFEFYWLAARNAHLLNSNEKHLSFNVMQLARDSLNNALRTVGTQQIMRQIQYDSKGYAYWEDFLGNYGNKIRGEDRNCVSALALNALLDIWTVSERSRNNMDRDNNRVKRRFVEGTPQEVREAINQGIERMINNKLKIFGDSNENAFFSLSLKNNASNPYFMPSNLNNFANGTSVDPHTTEFDWQFLQTLKIGVKGFIPKEEYEKLIKEKWFNQDTPEQFPGYNVGNGFSFAYWSSPALTYSMSLLAMSKYQTIEN